MELRMCLLLEFRGFYAEILKTTSPLLRVLCMALQWQTRFVTSSHCFSGETPFAMSVWFTCIRLQRLISKIQLYFFIVVINVNYFEL